MKLKTGWDQSGFGVLGVSSRNGKNRTLRLPRIIRLKENAPELDYSSFHGKTGAEDQLLCGFTAATRNGHPGKARLRALLV
jgi:hypothetical protein